MFFPVIYFGALLVDEFMERAIFLLGTLRLTILKGVFRSFLFFTPQISLVLSDHSNTRTPTFILLFPLWKWGNMVGIMID
jgi:hypothetical protein